MRRLVELCWLLSVICTALAASKNSKQPKIVTRPILADELRDFPGVCFASTQCGTVEVGRSWELSPFCGRSTCAKADDGRLVEVVEECAPPPEGCRVDDRRTDRKAPFPDCCPAFSCDDSDGQQQRDEEAAAQAVLEQEEPRRESRRRAGQRRRFQSRSRQQDDQE